MQRDDLRCEIYRPELERLESEVEHFELQTQRRRRLVYVGVTFVVGWFVTTLGLLLGVLL